MVELRDLPELHVIGWTNVNASGEPYPNLWEFVFGELDIDAKFDSIPSKFKTAVVIWVYFRIVHPYPDCGNKLLGIMSSSLRSK